jgi:release factor glutamine methyltransferase
MQWKLKNYPQRICEVLGKTIGIDRLEAEILLSRATGFKREFIIAHPEAEIGERELKVFLDMVSRRLRGEPIAYITQCKEFFSIPLYVDRGCFIPRPETEVLVQCALKFNPDASSVLDLGTGSGAIAIAFSINSPHSTVYASDISLDALMVAGKNIKKYGLEDRIFLIQGDCFSPFKGESFDIILSNPPYLSYQEYMENPELHFEPVVSLVAGKDGDEFIRRILREGLEYVKKGGYIMIEMGYGQAEKIIPLIKGKNFQIVKDLSGIDRVLILRKE